MPKLKTKSSAKKRFKITAKGKVVMASSWQKTWYDKKIKLTNKKTKRHNNYVKARWKNC